MIASMFFKNLSVYITGPIVNATLIIATLTLGLVMGIILSIIAPNYDKRTHKQTTIVWNLTIIYEFSDDEYQNSREKSFFEKTREGVSVFGYEKWFEDHIWNKK